MCNGHLPPLARQDFEPNERPDREPKSMYASRDDWYEKTYEPANARFGRRNQPLAAGAP